MQQALFVISSVICLGAAPEYTQAETLADYWPHEDGRTWLYEQHHEELFPPGVPTNDLARLWFEGTTVTPGGPVAQVLKSSVSGAPLGLRLDTQVPAEVTGPLLRRLWLARPDLRSAILKSATESPCPTEATPGWAPLLLSGGLAYVQTASEVAAWRCNVPNTKAWLWLTSDLDPGSTASLQLIPDLADDVFLHLQVFGLEDVTVPGGTFKDCLRVDYRIDYGGSPCTDGTPAFETTGFVRYAPGVGPIECLEELAGSEIPCIDRQLFTRSTLKLYAPSVPAKASSWGRVKSAYRH
jgi:hypothetical protein